MIEDTFWDEHQSIFPLDGSMQSAASRRQLRKQEKKQENKAKKAEYKAKEKTQKADEPEPSAKAEG